MQKYGIRIEITENEVKNILDELTAAQQKIFECYQRLEDLGVVSIKKATSDND
jgi:hypothetical protein